MSFTIGNWDEFKPGPNYRKARKPRVSLDRKGTLSFNSLAMELLDNAEAVVIFFDKIHSLIGIKDCDPAAGNAFPVYKNEGKYTFRVRGNSFCRYHRISVIGTVAFNRIEVDLYGIMVLDLREASSATMRKRSTVVVGDGKK